MYNISSGTASGPRPGGGLPTGKFGPSTNYGNIFKPSGNPFTPASDPLRNLYPNASAGIGGIDGKSGSALPSGASSSSGRDISYVYGTGTSAGHSSGSSRSSASGQKDKFDWKYADLAKHYGLTKETGYAEAMENTSYMRAVEDMKRAGLNPAVMFSRGADGAGTGYVYPSSDEGGGGGGGGGYSRSYGSARSRKLFSANKYAGLAGAGAIVGGIIGGITSKSAFGVSAGATAGATVATSIAKIVNGLLND